MKMILPNAELFQWIHCYAARTALWIHLILEYSSECTYIVSKINKFLESCGCESPTEKGVDF